ncbi:hypothetical protein ACLOJK_033444 [Asimina triloba]
MGFSKYSFSRVLIAFVRLKELLLARLIHGLELEALNHNTKLKTSLLLGRL